MATKGERMQGHSLQRMTESSANYLHRRHGWGTAQKFWCQEAHHHPLFWEDPPPAPKTQVPRRTDLEIDTEHDRAAISYDRHFVSAQHSDHSLHTDMRSGSEECSSREEKEHNAVTANANTLAGREQKNGCQKLWGSGSGHQQKEKDRKRKGRRKEPGEKQTKSTTKLRNERKKGVIVWIPFLLFPLSLLLDEQPVFCLVSHVSYQESHCPNLHWFHLAKDASSTRRTMRTWMMKRKKLHLKRKTASQWKVQRKGSAQRRETDE